MNILICFLFIVIGLFSLVSPNESWYLSHGWKYKNAEPSGTALVFIRISGIISIILGFVVLLCGIEMI